MCPKTETKNLLGLELAKSDSKYIPYFCLQIFSNMKYAVQLLVYLLIIEVFLRLGLKLAKDYSFWSPRYAAFHTEIENLDAINDTDYNILILGGSAISNALPAKIGIQIEDSLKLRGQQVRVIDIGMPARTSKDNLVILKLVNPDVLNKVDEVIYYESLNDTRYNCIPPTSFQDDYSHAHWYQELALMKAHPEMNYTIIPYVVDLFMQRLKERTGKVQMLNDELDVKPEFMDYGSEILTAKTFKNNLNEILSLFDTSKVKVTLLGYYIFIPEEMMSKENLGFWNEEKYFKAKGPRTTSGAWGYPWNAKKGLEIHNGILKEIAKSNSNIQFHDMAPVLSEIAPSTFFDISHFTEEGGSVFVSEILRLRDTE